MLGTYQRLGLHVMASNREVIRAARRKLRKAALRRTFRRSRHQFLRDMLRVHARERKLYLRVMRGDFG